MSAENSGMVTVIRMNADRADELAAQLQSMATSARKVERKKASLHEMIGRHFAAGHNPIDFDARQIKEGNSGARVETNGETGA